MNVEGIILKGRDFDPIEGRVVVEGGEIVAIEEESVDSSNIVIPAFVNAHTHLADAIAKEAGAGMDLDALVAPPDGLKHRLLAKTPRAEKVRAMAETLRFMETTGTAGFVEFREEDVEGVYALREALDGRAIDPTILGRGSVDAMAAGDGYGASGARDAEFSRERTATRKAGKLFGIHAGERDAGDLNSALDLDPDFLIHVVHPEALHLERIEDSETPVVICPRSNLVTGVGLPPLRELLERTSVALGTDNVMLNSPSMFREMEFAAKLFDVRAVEILRMATVAGADLAGLNYGLIETGRDGKLVVLDGDSDNLSGAHDVVRAVVRRAGTADIENVIL